MHLDGCIFAVALEDERLADDVARRAERLRRFYAPLTVEVVDATPRGEGASFTLSTEEFGPQTLYSAEHGGIRVFSTHAIAAGLIAGFDLRVDLDAVAQFIALDYVGGERTLLDGVRAVEPGTTVTLDGAGPLRVTTIPAHERWRAVPEAEAYEFTRQAVLEWIDQGTAGRLVALPLTAGLDSTVVAAALSELGRPSRAFTWGEPDWPDTVGAAATAERVGIEHDVFAGASRDGAECLRALDRDVRWGDGVARLAATERPWPDYGDVLAAGMGGEIGRAFYYNAWSARLTPRPGPERLVRQVVGFAQLQSFDAEIGARIEAAVTEWVTYALDAGRHGWNALDAVYADQRVRHWGRSQIPQLRHDFLPCFTGPDVARGLASQSLDDRLSDTFQRRFIDAHAMPVAPPPELPRANALQRLRYRMAPAQRGPREDDDPVDPLIPWIWSQRAEATEWVGDVVPTHPVITAVLGEQGARDAVAGFTEGRARSAERVTRAAGVVALCEALQELG